MVPQRSDLVHAIWSRNGYTIDAYLLFHLHLKLGEPIELDPVAQFVMPEESHPAELLLTSNLQHLEIVTNNFESSLIPFGSVELINLEFLEISVKFTSKESGMHSVLKPMPDPCLHRLTTYNILSLYRSCTEIFP